jgi:1,3-beta-glucanosyltransferase GAS5
VSSFGGLLGYLSCSVPTDTFTPSFSEYGCNTNGRNFEEVASLYSTNMTSVFSGGLVYEYANEVSNFGLVNIQGTTVTELPDFQALQTALRNTAPPQGDGGYKATGRPSTCPPPSPTWNVLNSSLPLIPEGAVKYMSQGAGQGPGYNGNSQNAGTASTGFGAASDGGIGSTPAKSAASIWMKRNVSLIMLVNILLSAFLW